jgi:hypothetical protein
MGSNERSNAIKGPFVALGAVAFLTDASHDKGMARHEKLVLFGNFAQDCFEIRALEFDHLFARLAVQMFVLRVAIIMFIAGALAKFDFTKETRINEFCEGAIDSGSANRESSFLHGIDELIRIEMIVLAENVAHHVPLLLGVALGLGPSGQIFAELIFR